MKIRRDITRFLIFTFVTIIIFYFSIKEDVHAGELDGGTWGLMFAGCCYSREGPGCETIEGAGNSGKIIIPCPGCAPIVDGGGGGSTPPMC